MPDMKPFGPLSLLYEQPDQLLTYSPSWMSTCQCLSQKPLSACEYSLEF